MICLFKDGMLAGLQFEAEEPPHRIRAEWLHYIPAQISIQPMDYAAAPDMMVNYKRGCDIYTRTTVHLDASINLDTPSVAVYLLERSY